MRKHRVSGRFARPARWRWTRICLAAPGGLNAVSWKYASRRAGRDATALVWNASTPRDQLDGLGLATNFFQPRADAASAANAAPAGLWLRLVSAARRPLRARAGLGGKATSARSPRPPRRRRPRTRRRRSARSAGPRRGWPRRRRPWRFRDPGARPAERRGTRGRGGWRPARRPRPLEGVFAGMFRNAPARRGAQRTRVVDVLGPARLARLGVAVARREAARAVVLLQVRRHGVPAEEQVDVVALEPRRRHVVGASQEVALDRLRIPARADPRSRPNEHRFC